MCSPDAAASPSAREHDLDPGALPIVLVRAIVPPCASAIALQIARPEAGAAALPRPAGIDPVEAVEDARLVLRRRCRRRCRPPRARQSPSARQPTVTVPPGRGVGQRVVDQVDQHLDEEVLVGDERRRRALSSRSATPASAATGAYCSRTGAIGLGQVDRVALERQPAGCRRGPASAACRPARSCAPGRRRAPAAPPGTPPASAGGPGRGRPGSASG